MSGIKALTAVTETGELESIDMVRAHRLAVIEAGDVEGARDGEAYCSAAAQLMSKLEGMEAGARQWQREAVEYAIAIGQLTPREERGRGKKITPDGVILSQQERSKYRQLYETPEDVREAYFEEAEAKGIPPTKSGLRQAAAGAARAARREAEKPPPETFPARFGPELYHCSLEDMPIEPGTLDAIITDPPYPKEFLPLYSTLSQCAARWLKPGAPLIVMTGQFWLPEVIARLSESQTYWWILGYMTPGESTGAIARNVTNIGWKPVLWFTNGPARRGLGYDVITSPANDKSHHYWGQSVGGMESLINAFTYEGERVCDPFLGGGTTAIAACRNRRYFVGCDVDADAIAATSKRYAE